jgi:hypothetical protein
MGGAGQFFDQAGLADSGVAGDQDQPPSAGQGLG